jgi:hypothetical protein
MTSPQCTTEYKYLFACGAIPHKAVGPVRRQKDGQLIYYMRHPGKDICPCITLAAYNLRLEISIRPTSVRRCGRVILIYDIHNETSAFSAVDADDVHHYLTVHNGATVSNDEKCAVHITWRINRLFAFMKSRNLVMEQWEKFFSNETKCPATSIWAYGGQHTDQLRCATVSSYTQDHQPSFSAAYDIFGNCWIVYKKHAVTMGLDHRGIYLRIVDNIEKYRACFEYHNMAIVIPGITYRIGRQSQKNILLACRQIVYRHMHSAHVEHNEHNEHNEHDAIVLQEIDRLLCVASDKALLAENFIGQYLGDECFAEIKNKSSESDYNVEIL